MLYEKSIHNETMGKWYYQNYNAFNAELPIRPFLFPFLTFLLHSFLGYQVANAFILNFLLLYILFVLTFVFVRRVLSDSFAYAAVILLCAEPVITQSATSASYDLLFCLCAFASFLSLRTFIRRPASDHFKLLWVHLLLLANTRHEAALFFVGIVFVLFVFKYIKVKYFKQSLIYSLTPLILLPTYWQRGFIKHDHQNAEGTAAFALEHFTTNLKRLGQSFVSFDFSFPYSPVLHLLGALGILYLLYLISRGLHAKGKKAQHVILITLLASLGHLALITSYHLGNPIHPTQSRLFLLFGFELTLMSLWFLSRLNLFKQKPINLLVFAAVLFFIYHPVSMENRFSNKQTLPRDYRQIISFLKQNYDQHILVISDRPGMYTVHNFGAVDFNYANQNERKLLRELDRHLFKEIIVIQYIEYGSNKPASNTRLDPRYKLKTLYELQRSAGAFTRISRVVTFDSLRFSDRLSLRKKNIASVTRTQTEIHGESDAEL